MSAAPHPCSAWHKPQQDTDSGLIGPRVLRAICVRVTIRVAAGFNAPQGGWWRRPAAHGGRARWWRRPPFGSGSRSSASGSPRARLRIVTDPLLMIRLLFSDYPEDPPCAGMAQRSIMSWSDLMFCAGMTLLGLVVTECQELLCIGPQVHTIWCPSMQARWRSQVRTLGLACRQDGVDLVDEDDRRRHARSDREQRPHLRTITSSDV